MSRTGRLLTLAVLSLLLLGYSGTAGAALKVCNKTKNPASMAFGFIYADGAITEGWYNLQPGECTTIDGFDGTAETKGLTTYYYYAHSSAGAWDGDTQMCVDMTNLNFAFNRPPSNPLQNCGNGDGGAAKGFRRVNLKTKDAELDLDQIY